MKKSLIALAALASVGAFAQSSVQIIGTFDPSVANEKTTYANGNSVTQNYVRNNSQGTSQITFKGTEDLGGGLKASFLLENDFDARFDANGNPWNGKNAFGANGGEQFLALQGGFGQLQVGAANTPTLTTQASRQPFSTKLGGGFNGVTGTGHVRNNNSLVYTTPTFSGFTAAVGYAFQTKADVNAAGAYNISTGEAKTVAGLNTKGVGSILDIGLNYANGPLAAGVSFYTVDAVAAVSNTLGVTTAATTAGGKNKQTNLYASYDLGVAKLIAGYHVETTDNATAGAAKVLDAKGYNLATVVPLSTSLSLLANFGKLDDKTSANADKKITAIGLKYTLSKMTSVYARYVDQKNDNVTGNGVSGIKTTLVGMQTGFDLCCQWIGGMPRTLGWPR